MIAASVVLAAVIVSRTPAQRAVGIDATCVPVVPPTVMGVKMHYTGSSTYRVFRTWSDGQIDVTGMQFRFTKGCDLDPSSTCTVVILPGSCPTDMNRDGDTGQSKTS